MDTKLKYKSSDILISRIKEDLSTFDSSGVVDVGKFYFWIKRELQLLGSYIYQDERVIIDVENNRCELPEDFIRLYALYSLNDQMNDKYYEMNGVQQDMVYIVEDTYQKETVGDCDEKCYDEKYLVRHISKVNTKQYFPYKPNHSRLLRYSGRVRTEMCDEDSPNYFSKDDYEFNIDSNYMYFNFEKGRVLLEYLAFPYDEDGYPLIPDEPKIEQAIEDYIRFKLFEYFYLNDISNNPLQKMQFLKMQYETSHKSALNYIKLPDFQTSMDTAYKNVKNRFKLFEIKRNGRFAYSTTNRDAEGTRFYPFRFPRV